MGIIIMDTSKIPERRAGAKPFTPKPVSNDRRQSRPFTPATEGKTDRTYQRRPGFDRTGRPFLSDSEPMATESTRSDRGVALKEPENNQTVLDFFRATPKKTPFLKHMIN